MSSSSKISLVNLPGTASKQWSIAIGVTFFVYLSVVRAIRWRRYNSIHRKYEHKFLQGERLSPEEAQEIMHTSAMYDMPLLMNYALSFALFKTYAIPSISQILSDTKELKSVEGMSKRYADTELLISTWVFCPISGRSQESPLAQSSSPETKRKGEEVTVQVDDPRAMIALARVNWLHSKYPITNDDYLYTLGLFIFEPVYVLFSNPQDWTNTYGWRGLSLMESHAFFIFWVEIGRRMGIKDIPESPESFRQWIMVHNPQISLPPQAPPPPLPKSQN
ncbi:hypothetical protein D9757_009463 [Collybiopsis confluens]|uniref:ER-bound oxygenase mpaB/mpaB'/Rubber oxygenase catalytic domain-containing protein n=1 Tax=Collybiopsis confluens TaxID=2823264 RepID=A0A8H5H4G6_9AGAR|nr:hypothetical protein D9757_009463 [Collybiopsis confluens]